MAHDFTGDASIVFLDIETNTKHDQIWCCVTKKGDEVIVWTEARKLNEYLSRDDTLVMHNGISFDAPILNRLWSTKIRLSQCRDTLIMSRLMNPNRENGHSLAAWGNNLGYPKIEFSDYDGGLSDEMVEYCIRDVEVLERVYYALEDEKRVYEFSQQSVDLEHEVAAIVSRQERRGFRLDVPFAMVLASSLKDRAAIIEQELQQFFEPIVTERISEKTGKKLQDKIEIFNLSSRQQIAKRLTTLGWKPKKKTEKGSIIVDESTLEEIGKDARYVDKPVLVSVAAKLQEYLLLSKRASQVQSWLDAVQEDGRVRGKVITNGAVTGRMTHSSPNMAQIPSSSSPYGEECRQCWTVDDGYKLVGIDASGLELRMLAHYMKDKDYVREVCEGDIHTKNQNAAGLQTRPQAKTFIYAFLYGAGPAKIGAIVGGGAQEGQRLIGSFLDNTPALKALRTKIDGLAEKGYLPGLDGRKLFIRSAHAALNTLLQGAGAIVMKQGLILLNKKIQQHKINAHFVANVHDEWQIEVEEQYADVVGKLGVEAIQEAGQVLKMFCPLTGEYRVGNNWKETH
jgi:DNA polymerase I-like protein with 3'-5' exonuclease and polymerase domains